MSSYLIIGLQETFISAELRADDRFEFWSSAELAEADAFSSEIGVVVYSKTPAQVSPKLRDKINKLAGNRTVVAAADSGEIVDWIKDCCPEIPVGTVASCGVAVPEIRPYIPSKVDDERRGQIVQVAGQIELLRGMIRKMAQEDPTDCRLGEMRSRLQKLIALQYNLSRNVPQARI